MQEDTGRLVQALRRDLGGFLVGRRLLHRPLEQARLASLAEVVLRRWRFWVRGRSAVRPDIGHFLYFDGHALALAGRPGLTAGGLILRGVWVSLPFRLQGVRLSILSLQKQLLLQVLLKAWRRSGGSLISEERWKGFLAALVAECAHQVSPRRQLRLALVYLWPRGVECFTPLRGLAAGQERRLKQSVAPVWAEARPLGRGQARLRQLLGGDRWKHLPHHSAGKLEQLVLLEVRDGLLIAPLAALGLVRVRDVLLAAG